MRCIGVNKNLKRCKNKAIGLYCKSHKKQWILILFISIPSFLGLYAGLFQDLIKPIFYTDNVAKEKFESRQVEEVMSLVDSLTANSVYYKLFIDSLYGDCVFLDPPKCPSPYFEIISNLFMIGDVYYMAIDDVKFRSACFHIQVHELDTAVNNNGNNVYYGRSDIWVDGKCNFTFDEDLFIIDDKLFEYARSFYKSEYVPKSIKTELNNLLSLKYRPLKMSDASANFDRWLVLFKSDEKQSTIGEKTLRYIVEGRSINEKTLIYSVEDQYGKISAHDFMRILNNLGFSIHTWRNKKGIYTLPNKVQNGEAR